MRLEVPARLSRGWPPAPPRSPHSRLICLAVVLGAATALVAGCGGGGSGTSSATKSSSRPATSTVQHRAEVDGIPTRATLVAEACVKGKPALEQRLHVGAEAITGRLVESTDGSPQCDFAVMTHGGPLRFWLSLDNAPQPYQVLDRRSTEEGQNFGFVKHFKLPKSIDHLGLIGWWFPREQQTVTTDGRILITFTFIHWAQRRPRPRIALSAAVARAYLGPLKRGARLVGD